MAISLTESAADRVRDYLENRGTAIGLRLGVTKTGLLRLLLRRSTTPTRSKDHDVVFEDKGIKVVVDPEAAAADRRYRGRFRQETA